MPLTLDPDLPVKIESGWAGWNEPTKGAEPAAIGVSAASSKVVRCESGLQAEP
jgi:hypothetical protein